MWLLGKCRFLSNLASYHYSNWLGVPILDTAWHAALIDQWSQINYRITVRWQWRYGNKVLFRNVSMALAVSRGLAEAALTKR